MAKARGKADDTVAVAGFTVAQWKHHMDHDEDWTERLDGAGDAVVAEIVGALGHAEPNVRALACNLVYAVGVRGLGGRAAVAIEQLGELAASDKNKKVRTRAGLVHESMASELQRANIRQELAWLDGYDPAAHPQALEAIADPRDEVRLQTYLWWANVSGVPGDVGRDAVAKLMRQVECETDDLRRRAAEIARDHLRSQL
jgi:hypothetical protein